MKGRWVDMPADTTIEMYFGFVVILGILGLYSLSLVWRFRRLHGKGNGEDHTVQEPENPSPDA
jgi:hypothetical protein